MDGNGNINVTAPKDITISAGANISISAGQNITASAVMNISESAGMNHSSIAGAMMVQNAGEDYILNAANILEMAKENFDSHSSEYKKISGEIIFNSHENDIKINTPKKVNLQSGEKGLYS